MPIPVSQPALCRHPNMGKPSSCQGNYHWALLLFFPDVVLHLGAQELDLRSNMFTGTLPSYLGKQLQMQRIRVDQNNFRSVTSASHRAAQGSFLLYVAVTITIRTDTKSCQRHLVCFNHARLPLPLFGDCATHMLCNINVLFLAGMHALLLLRPHDR